MKKIITGIFALTLAMSGVITAGAQAADEVYHDGITTAAEDDVHIIRQVNAEPDFPLYAFIRGDVDNSGKIDIEDAVMVVSSINGIKPLDETQAKAADMNEDGEVDIEDVAKICNEVIGAPDVVTKPEPQQPEPEPETEPVDTRPRTSKGYVIEEKDGITYIDGIMIANKTYSLPSSYAPGGLTAETSAAFSEMQSGAWADGISLWNCSGYRSYWYQSDLYWGYVSRDGQAAADRYSARPGHSEHQTGLALDVNYASSWFDTTKEAQWIAAHCADYGFILRYPKGKEDVTGYMYESWHIRYVGKDLARKITDSGLTLEEYFGIDSYYH